MKTAHRSIPRVLAVAIALCVAADFALAYNPPVDTAGSLTVRIEGPGEVTETGTFYPVRVVIENGGDKPIEGRLRVEVIDAWWAEPDGDVAFAVGAKETVSKEFAVAAGTRTYSAHYPIHAYVNFEADGKQLTAHPILILEANVPQPALEAAPIEWQPVKMPPVGRLALWRVPVQRSVIGVFGQEPLTMPVGWQGSEEKSLGSTAIRQETLDGEARDSLSIHPPWSEGRLGTHLIEYPLELPESKPLVVKFANGMTPTGQSDGVTFRVRVLPLDAPQGQFGQVVFERHTATKSWLEAEADLSRFAGQKVRLQFESHPGPENNTGWDHCYWAEPTLIAATPPAPLPMPPGADAESRLLGKTRCGDKQYDVRIWPGGRGLLDSIVGFSDGDQSLYFRGFEVRVLGGRIDDDRSPILLETVSEEPCDDGLQIRHSFRGIQGSFELVGRLSTDDGVLRAEFYLEKGPPPKPWFSLHLEDVAAGPWSHRLEQVYAGAGNVIRNPESFRLGFDGHRMATSFAGFDFADSLSIVQGADVPPMHLDVRTSDKHVSLHAAHHPTLTFIPTGNVWEGVKVWREVNGLAAAGGVEKTAGRFVFDLWGGRYGESADELRQAFRYGLTDSMVVWHNWQRWGYDYRLPNIYPPNPKMGNLDEIRDLIDVCKRSGVIFALHDNYIDFYPDADGFSYRRNIAFHQNGKPVLAWLNEGRDARSYRYRSDRIEPFLKPNLQLIRDELQPTGYFIDVWSSARPYDYWTADGRFFTSTSTRNTWGELFAWIRDLFGDNAPQISESGHDQLIGWLDGAQTNHLRVGEPMPGRMGWCVWNWKCSDAERTPWYDAAHHDRFILHGAGYSSRYEGGLDGRLHGMYSDDYISTEVLTGHPAMVSRPFGSDVVRKYWLLAELMRALAMRQIESVEFVDDDLHRQYVKWSGGGEIWVNRGQTDWHVAGAILPQYGFLARVPGEDGPVEASIARRDGLIVETASSPRQTYVNGRRMIQKRMPISLSVEKLEYQGNRNFTLSLGWDAKVAIPAGWTPFLHFCDPAGEIIFQGIHDPGTFGDDTRGTISASARAVVPDELEPGQSFELCFGIYNRASGRRLTLIGPDLGDGRIRLGKVKLDGDGDSLKGVSWEPHQAQADPLLARRNPDGRPVDFGLATTEGGCRFTRDGDSLVVTPLPGAGSEEFTVSLRWPALPWQLPQPTHVEAIAADGTVQDPLPIVREGKITRLECHGGTFAYRLLQK